MYLIALTLGFCLAYFVIMQIFSLFFLGRLTKPPRKAVLSVALIFVLAVLGYVIAFTIPDLELGNRVLHTFVGGMLTFFICYLAVRDARFKMNRFQFFLMSALIVTGLGVLNEHIEFFLQTYVRILFYSNPNDTWLDLLSNTVGILLGAACFTPFVNRAATSPQKE